jgi:inner membrane protein
MVWKTKMLHFAKYITKGLFISSFICFYLVVKLYALHQFEKALNKQRIHYSEIIVKPQLSISFYGMPM